MSEQDTSQVLEQRERWKDAFQARDIDRTMAFYADDDVTYDINPPLRFETPDARRRNWKAFFGGFDGDLVVEFADDHVVRSDDLAVVYQLTRVSGTTTFGTRADLWTRQTNVLRRIDGEWLYINNHLSLPVDLAENRPVADLQP